MSDEQDRDGFDDRDGSGWREPEHLGEGSGQEPAQDGSPSAAGGAGWQPPGWDLPAAEPDRTRQAGSEAGYGAWPEDRSGAGTAQREAGGPDWQGRGLGRGHARGEVDRVFAYQGDPVGAQGWALQQGWEISDGSGPGDAGLAVLIATAPTRLTRDHRPAGVMRGRYGGLDLVAFDVVYADKRRVIPEYAVTAAPVLATIPGLRLSPARFWKHRTGGMVPIPSGDPEFEARWVLLAEADTPAVRRLVEDPTVRGLLLGSDDGDEFWSAPAGNGGGMAGGYVAAIRPDGQRPELIEHHARLLTAVVGALAVSS